MDFKDKLRQIRIDKGFSKTELARVCGVTVHTIYRLESGVTVPKVATIILLSDALGIDAEEFLDKDTNQAAAKNIRLADAELKTKDTTSAYMKNRRIIETILTQIERLKKQMIDLYLTEDDNKAEAIAGDIESISEKIRTIEDKAEELLERR